MFQIDSQTVTVNKQRGDDGEVVSSQDLEHRLCVSLSWGALGMRIIGATWDQGPLSLQLSAGHRALKYKGSCSTNLLWLSLVGCWWYASSALKSPLAL